MAVVRDQMDRKVEVNIPPKRIVSLVPSQTELLVDLGLEDYLVGITKFCVHPKDLREKKQIVGGTKQVHLDRIAKLAPDLVLCNKEENTREMVAQLEEIAPVHVSDVKTLDDSLELIREYGEIFELREKASGLVGEIIDKREDFLKFIVSKPVKRVAYLIWRNPWMVVGRDTFVDHLLKLNNFENVFSDEKLRYPTIELEDLKERKVEIVLLSTEPFPFKKEHKKEIQEVNKTSQILIVDGEFFSWYGSRLTKAFDYFKKLQQSSPFS